MHTDYRSSIVKQLRDQQVRFAPREKKVEQVNRAEKLLNEIDPSKTYSYEYVCFRITKYRPETGPVLTLSGEDASHDLRLFVEDVSDAANIRVEDASEPVHTVEELSSLFKVSTKTISRWRQNGLVGRRFLFGRRKRVGFLRSSVDRFVKTNGARVQRGKRFTQMSTEERDEIILRARRMAQSGACLSEIARRIARQMQRSVETVRYTLRQFDSEHPDLAIFPNAEGLLNEAAKTRIYQAHRRGLTIDKLAERYRRTRTSIYRIINEKRARRLLELPLDHIHNPEFEGKRAAEQILAAFPSVDESLLHRTRPPAGLPSYLAALYETPLLTREQEVHLFRRMNYLKYLASQLRDKLDPARARGSVMNQFERLYEQAVEAKNEIVQANLRLVVSIAKRHVTPSDDFYTLVSDGNVSLIRAVEKFDYGRGNKFSTYASWAIMKNFARSIPGESKHRDRFRTSLDELFSGRVDDRSGQYEQETAQRLREQQINRILARLDEREQRIIISRFGLDHSQEPRTLKEVGADLGVTKERVRQIEARALDKLRAVVEEESFEFLE